ncbi:MAG: hypothetical protein ABW185_17600 [Sedimenticola sp.]
MVIFISWFQATFLGLAGHRLSVAVSVRRTEKSQKETTKHFWRVVPVSNWRNGDNGKMGAGLHSGNGLKQDICARLWSSEIVPRLTFGLEVMNLKIKDINVLEAFQRKCLKQIQGLPDKTPNIAALALLGIAPVETIIHKNMLTLFGNVIRNEHSIEHDIAVRQLVMKTQSEHSWFNKIKSLLEKYNLPSAYNLLKKPPTKTEWKRQVKRSIHKEITEQWRKDASEKYP